MEHTTQHIANVFLIRVQGRLDHTTAKAFETMLIPHLDDCTGETKKVLLDFGGVGYISSAGLRVLMLAAKQCRKQNGEMALAALAPHVQEVFKISRFDLVLQTFPTVPAALAALSPAAAAAYHGQA